jgi:hypothetical protein
MGKWWAFVVLFAAGVMAGDAQQQKSPPARAGVVSGRIFAVTKGGDLKPARMATVVLLYVYRSEKAANANPEELDSAGMAWLDSRLHAMKELTRTLAAEGANWSDSLVCHKRLLTYNDALSATLSWAREKHKAWQILSTDADEDGMFKVAVPHQGKYTIVAIGQAGFNDAVWEAKDVRVNPGMTTAVKLSSPAESCLASLTE